MSGAELLRSEALELAFGYARRGIAAGPVAISWDAVKGKTTKRPLTPEGFRSFTTDHDTLVRLFDRKIDTSKQKWAVGLWPGPAGFMVVDVDVLGDDGAATLADLEREHGELPQTWRVVTASGGAHVWLRKPEGARIGNAFDPAGIDLRADDGFVVAPGTRTPWGSWEWEADLGPDDLVPAEAPAWLLGLTSVATRSGRSPGSAVPGEVAQLAAQLERDGFDQTAQALRVLCSERYGGHHPATKASEPGVVYVSRPGKAAGTSATIGYVAPGVVKIFTSGWGRGLAAERRYVVAADGETLEDADTLPEGDTGEEAGEAGGGGRGRPSTASKLVALAECRYRFLPADDGRAYAVPLVGPQVARPLNGGRPSLSAELADAFHAETGQVPARSAIVDALAVLEGRAQAADPEPIGLRAEYHGGLLSVDLGRPDGHVLMIGPDVRQVVERSPVLFRRTELTGPMPNPTDDDRSDLDRLQDIVNVTPADFGLLVAWMLAAYFPWNRPVLLLGGEQGSGKSTAARTIVSIIDPSPVPLRAAPKDLESWVIGAAGSLVVAVDNVSRVPEWLSDAWCRASTGEGLLRRKLYSDGALAVTKFRRAVVVTSIDAGALRGDLAERLLCVELDRITPAHRRTEDELDLALCEARPAILGGLADLAMLVLAELPEVTVPDPPRMADFARILAAVDRVMGWDTLARYREVTAEIVADVVHGDPLAAALLAVGQSGWFGSATQLLEAIRRYCPDPNRPPKSWPTTANRVRGEVTRLAPALRAAGLSVEHGRTRDGSWFRLHSAGCDGRDDRDGRPSVDGRKIEEEGRRPEYVDNQKDLTVTTVTTVTDRVEIEGEW